MFHEPHIDHLDLPCPRLPRAFDGLVILHLSDMHISEWSRQLDLWRYHFSQLRPSPHLVLMTGDLGHRSWLWKTSLASITRLLDPLTPPLGTFFILGNHDSVKLGPALAQTCDQAGMPRTLLRNETAFISPSDKKDDARLAIIGIHQHRRIDTDIPFAMAEVRPSDFKLVMLHYPDLIHPAISAGADVCLAGHTHGGQICWPDGRPFFRQDTLPPQLCTGIHRINGTWMVVNRGIGAAGIRMRLFCPPQAIQLTLRTAKSI